MATHRKGTQHWGRSAGVGVLFLVVLASCSVGPDDPLVPIQSSSSPLAAVDEADNDDAMLVNDGAGIRRVIPPRPAFAASEFKPAAKPVAALSATEMRDWREEALREARNAPPGEWVQVKFELRDQDFDWKSLRRASTPALHEAAIARRKSDLATSQAALVGQLENLGARNIATFWLTNSVVADLTPAQVAVAIANTLVVSASVSSSKSPRATPAAYWDGKVSTEETHIRAMYNTTGLDGHWGNIYQPSSPVVLGIVEPSSGPNDNNFILRNHAAFAGRLVSVKECTAISCVDSPGDAGSVDTHGTQSAWVAAGNIEAGQDPNFPSTGTPAQQMRTGHLRGALIRYYVVTGGVWAASSRAVEQAIADHVDVLNHSYGYHVSGQGTSGYCQPTWDFGGLNGAINSALNAGVVNVFAAGNSGLGLPIPPPPQLPPCTLWYPAGRPEALTAGWASAITTPYEQLQMNAASSHGREPITTLAGSSKVNAGVDLSAPADLLYYAMPPGNSYATAFPTGGTSAAAPVITAMTGGIRTSFYPYLSITDGRVLMANALLLGDGWDGETLTIQSQGMSAWSGAGKAVMHWPDELLAKFPAGWNWSSINVLPGQYTYLPIGSSNPAVTITKVAAFFTTYDGSPNDLLRAPDVDFTIQDTCPPGGGVADIASDNGYNFRARFRLTSVAGKCLRLRAYGYAVPAAGTRVQVAYYYHGGSIDHE